MAGRVIGSGRDAAGRLCGDCGRRHRRRYAADMLPRVFEPFFTTKPTGAGTGLGLSQVYGFVRQSGGFVHLESEPGRGTTVRLYLPGNKQTEPTAGTPKAPVKAGDKIVLGAGKTVLVVEDVEIVRAQIVEVLSDMGFVVLEAKDGPDGLRILQSSVSVDLLLTDVGLPGMNGRQLADAGRELRPGLRSCWSPDTPARRSRRPRWRRD